jgi:hypothetical protein
LIYLQFVCNNKPAIEAKVEGANNAPNVNNTWKHAADDIHTG